MENEILQPDGASALENEDNTLVTKIQELEEALLLSNDILLREKAESENVRRRATKEADDASKYAVTSFARDLIEVLENLYRAVDNISGDSTELSEKMQNFVDGVAMTQKILLNAFEKHGIARIHPLDEPFDHHYHQAISQAENAEKAPNTVLQVIRSGYKIKDRLLQPALVVVSKQ